MRNKIFGIFILILCSVTAFADTFTWDGAVSSDWDTSANWLPNGVPGVGDDVIISSGFVTLNSNKEINTLTFTAGTIDGSGTLTIDVSMTWNSGTMSGSGTTKINAGATVAISGSSIKSLTTRTLDNSGDITWTGTGEIKLNDDAHIFNRAGALFDIQNDVRMDFVLATNGGHFDNAGTLTKSAGDGINRTEIDPIFTNSGTVNANGGILRFERGDTTTALIGDFNVTAGNTLVFAERLFIFDGVSIGGDGTVNIINRPILRTIGSGLTVGSSVTVLFDTDQSGTKDDGFFEGDGPLTVNGTFQWSQGVIKGTGDFTVNGSLQIINAHSRTLDGRTLTNTGTAVWSGSSRIDMSNNAVFLNQSGGSFDVQSNAKFDFIAPNGGTFNNAGTIMGSADLDISGVTFTNTGNFAPGNSAGNLSITGDVSLASTSAVNIEIGGATAGSEFDQLNISGQAALDGTLNISLINGFVPQTGQTYEIVFGSTVSGSFSTINQPQANGSDLFSISYLSDRVKLTTSRVFNEQITAGWNLIGLPYSPADNFYLNLFPNATENTLYTYSDGYTQEENLLDGTGYWLAFPATEALLMSGTEISSVTLDLITGWNIIAGPSCDVALANVNDPNGIIVPNTLYGYDSGYIASTVIEQGKGYWVKANANGQITIDCAAANLTKVNNDIKGIDLQQYPALLISDAVGNRRKLYFNVEVSPERSQQLSLPPVSPPGSFDVRFVGDYRAIEGDAAQIRLQTSDYPVTISAINFPAGNDESYVIEEIFGKEVISTHPLSENHEVIIANSNITRLKLSKVVSMPNKFFVEQNYPNPFNPITTIHYGIPKKANVSVIIYNAIGQKVKTLVSQNQEAGFHMIQWDGTNDTGQTLSSGIFMLSIKAGGYIGVKKMLLVK